MKSEVREFHLMTLDKCKGREREERKILVHERTLFSSEGISQGAISG